MRDNGRGIPVDPHPKFKNKSALEVIMTTLHAGGKFDGKVYDTSGGLHGVGASVVNALSEWMEVDVARDKRGHKMRFERGQASRQAEGPGRGQPPRHHRHASSPTPRFSATRISRRRGCTAWRKSKAYLFRGVEIRWYCDPSLIKDETPGRGHAEISRRPARFSEERDRQAQHRQHRGLRRAAPKTGTARGAVEWAVAWTPAIDPFVRSYCNTIPTPQGGTHEQGLRNALTKALRAHGERANNRKTGLITADDVMEGACAVLSVFIREPEFQGQTKDKLSSPDAQRLVENVVRDHFDHWLAESPADADKLLDFVIDQAEDRLKQAAGKGSHAQSRDPQTAPARQAGRLHARRGARAPRFSWSKAIPPAAAPSRRATAPPRRSCPCAARS